MQIAYKISKIGGVVRRCCIPRSAEAVRLARTILYRDTSGPNRFTDSGESERWHRFESALWELRNKKAKVVNPGRKE